ncbi:uncharacterized protein B0H18DRAFT_1115209 [Fomitopsis serialis]|uniref:uncharacterized protein n=1 Tax=Fomitopsis serialis TaxID=139415 RepID=UPI0020076CEB|nr:uncharacterized protein B0H18DRAFT_1115209 [Neoantrodia serialis]KAH9933847.1 hypothetical protein B0H18DRAFT_1115209 [Neoantrodia serialis]
MSPRTRSADSKKLTAQAKATGSRARKTNKVTKTPNSSKAASKSGGEAPLSAKEQKQLELLLRRQSVQKKSKDEEHQAGEGAQEDG